MKEYPVGSLCVIKGEDVHSFFKGRECTIVEGQRMRRTCDFTTKKARESYTYLIEVEGSVEHAAAQHKQLTLKKFPPALDQWCNETMLKVLKPVEIKDEEVVK